MASLILISTLAILAMALCLTLTRMILGQSKTDRETTAGSTSQLATALSDFQAAQTKQLGEVLDRHSSDLKQVLSAQSQYINQFLNGSPIPADRQPLNPQDGPDLSLSDPANWSLEDQMAHLPRQMQQEIEREQMEQDEINRLLAPSHPIRYNPKVPIVVPGMTMEEQAQANGSWTMSEGPEG